MRVELGPASSVTPDKLKSGLLKKQSRREERRERGPLLLSVGRPITVINTLLEYSWSTQTKEMERLPVRFGWPDFREITRQSTNRWVGRFISEQRQHTLHYPQSQDGMDGGSPGMNRLYLFLFSQSLLPFAPSVWFLSIRIPMALDSLFFSVTANGAVGAPPPCGWKKKIRFLFPASWTWTRLCVLLAPPSAALLPFHHLFGIFGGSIINDSRALLFFFLFFFGRLRQSRLWLFRLRTLSRRGSSQSFLWKCMRERERRRPVDWAFVFLFGLQFI